MPKVSVIIPTYNRPHYIWRAIQSVLNQTLQDFEIIVVDDGTKKRADKVVAKFADDRIIYIQNQQSLGGGASRNVGIKKARGKYIAFLDDDDEWNKEKLQKQVEAFERCGPEVSVVFCGVEAYDTQGKKIYTTLPNEQGMVQPLEKLLHKCYIWTSALMLRQSYIDKGGLFDESFKKNQEWDLLVRLAKISKFFAINEPLTHLHILDEDEYQMGGKSNMNNIIDGHKRFIEAHLADYQKLPKSLALRYFVLGVLYRDNGQFSEARRVWKKSWKTIPTNFVYMRHYLLSLFGKNIYNMSVRMLGGVEK